MGSMVRNTSFSVYAGQITGIFGLVGAGRTETMKVVAGVLKRDFFHGGEVRLEGKPVRYRVPRQAVRDGIVYVTEDRKVEGFFETMSIAENIQTGARRKPAATRSTIVSHGEGAHARPRPGSRRSRPRHRRQRARHRAFRRQPAEGRDRQVAGAEAEAVIFDEPTRGVDVGAIVEIHQLINRLADEGFAVVVISSYLPEIMALSDRILVARQGRSSRR